MSLKVLLWLISTGKMPAVPAPSGSEGGGGYLRHARTRHGASVRGYTRRRFRCRSLPPQWRHLRFTIQRRWSPKKDVRYDSTSLDDLSIPRRGVLDFDLLDGGELVGGDVVYLNQDVPRVQARSRRDSPRFRRRLRQTGQAPSPRMLPPLLVYSCPSTALPTWNWRLTAELVWSQGTCIRACAVSAPRHS